MTIQTTPPDLDPNAVHWQHRERLPVWTVYERPTDYPDGYVARMFLSIGRTTNPEVTQVAIYAASLREVRSRLPAGLCQMARHEADDPHIVESWI